MDLICVKLEVIELLLQKFNFFTCKNLSKKPWIFYKLKTHWNKSELHRFCKENVIELHNLTVSLLETDFSCLVSSCYAKIPHFSHWNITWICKESTHYRVLRICSCFMQLIWDEFLSVLNLDLWWNFT